MPVHHLRNDDHWLRVRGFNAKQIRLRKQGVVTLSRNGVSCKTLHSLTGLQHVHHISVECVRWGVCHPALCDQTPSTNLGRN